jgi:hypothetical protein
MVTDVTFRNFIYDQNKNEGERISCILTFQGKTYTVTNGIVSDGDVSELDSILSEKPVSTEVPVSREELNEKEKKITDAIKSALVAENEKAVKIADAIRNAINATQNKMTVYENTNSKDIAKTANAKDYYKIMGLQRNATPEEIKKAYHKLALIHHPDKGGDVTKFTELGEAYSTLSDPVKREKYDRDGFVGGGQFTKENANEIFRQFFGGDYPFA